MIHVTALRVIELPSFDKSHSWIVKIPFSHVKKVKKHQVLDAPPPIFLQYPPPFLLTSAFFPTATFGATASG